VKLPFHAIEYAYSRLFWAGAGGAGRFRYLHNTLSNYTVFTLKQLEIVEEQGAQRKFNERDWTSSELNFTAVQRSYSTI
tara:strand:+ start:1478 stop:1714 length:237 start_codon:yes stop_codon:yes gene_type:complete